MRGLLTALALALVATPAMAQERLAPLAFLDGCWVGVFDGPQAQRDERCFTTILNGNAVRDTHTVVGAGDSGDTTYYWNGETRRIEVSYVSNDGGLMTGRVAEEEGVLWVRDARYIGADGQVLNLRSRWLRESGDAFVVETEREENGVWSPFMRISYRRALSSP